MLQSVSESFLEQTETELEVPVLEHNYLLSPPPSPPPEWHQSPEEIGKIPFLDLDADVFEGKTQVLLSQEGLPRITVDYEET
jgi:hypothetical protein